jgi:signal peptidase I
MKRRSGGRSWAQMGVVFALLLTARASFADHYRVPSGSMEPTVHVGDHIVVAKAAYGLRVPLTSVYLASYDVPKRGEVIVLSSPADGTVLLKRVVATEGEVVSVRDGRVSIGGRAVADDPGSLELGGGPDFGPVKVPEQKLLVLGDNRGNSRDGRELGFIDRAAVLGRAVAVVQRDGKLTWDPL